MLIVSIDTQCLLGADVCSSGFAGQGVDCLNYQCPLLQADAVCYAGGTHSSNTRPHNKWLLPYAWCLSYMKASVTGYHNCVGTHACSV